MSEAKINALVKARDGLRMAADAVDEFLGTLAPNKPQGAQVNLAFDAAKLVWQDKLGPKGPYQICTETDNPEFKRMMTILEAGGDRTTHLGMFYWIMTGRTAVARKPRK